MWGILLGLVVLMVLAYLGWSIVWVAPIAAGVVALTGGLDWLETYTQTYMGGFCAFAKVWFPVFMLGAIFGKLMEMSGMASAIARLIAKTLGQKRAILGVVLACALLTYGGVSLFVVVFCVYPLSLSLFQVVCALVMFVGGYLYLRRQERRYQALGESYDAPSQQEQTLSANTPPVWLSLLPLLCVVCALNVFSLSIIYALLGGIGLILMLSVGQYKRFVGAINAGAKDSILALINTCAAVGFGSVVKVMPSFHTLAQHFLSAKSNPLICEAITINILAGATGSASGGMGIALEALGAEYAKLALSTHIPLELLHRVASVASGGLDALPHNGAVLTLLAITQMDHKRSYKDIAVVAVVIPVFALVVGMVLASFGVY
ncbi:GntP family permease [Helicobacter ailurogastricus]|uniref:D-beta-hydroxybutyrate permease n=1 Tax=Helicobacter ailurogastricus TaxID=1578720 RepID=A0A0K2Y5E7_9HELI|nr:TRAP transporter large permease subunit [Helicobacter ailurogastricus]BDQ28540.1 citrate transporter [Helicobacter ailurogastricus]CRF53069.1 D-beta-hydroxybutyrate permease [Helicobacter ailurogastricus]